MPKAARTSNSSASSARQEPYSKPSSKPKSADKAEKENIAPGSTSGPVPKTKSKPKPKSKSSKPSSDPNIDWRDIELEQQLGEVPCYDNASIVRRKLKNLLQKKSEIPCQDNAQKKWTQVSMANEMLKLEERDGPVTPAQSNCNGPSARSLGIFLKKTGEMAGGDSACYYWGYVLLEKLRIYNGEKKSKSRLEAEDE
ncbi:MAG: hypothetical protein Q9216_002911 [Gyalolechia sp. 2 TL-2023]